MKVRGLWAHFVCVQEYAILALGTCQCFKGDSEDLPKGETGYLAAQSDPGSNSERSTDSPMPGSEDDLVAGAPLHSPEWSEERFRVDRKKLEAMLQVRPTTTELPRLLPCERETPGNGDLERLPTRLRHWGPGVSVTGSERPKAEPGPARPSCVLHFGDANFSPDTWAVPSGPTQIAPSVRDALHVPGSVELQLRVCVCLPLPPRQDPLPPAEGPCLAVGKLSADVRAGGGGAPAPSPHPAVRGAGTG
ncbi:Protein bicaudal C like protein 1 [Tupaia chinensis]|uniref:Protein bicaudal C like protein 1 n=1 Tax=Tupaia chinensis TaxID=246437 RepID=L9KWX7_TUPCH|nr:Protein bicaudal C like protein 1 [Tupaia chinensis]